MNKEQRKQNLMRNGIPKYIRAYDNGGETADRYTVVYTGRIPGKLCGWYFYVAMSENPYHPQGVGIHGEHFGRFDLNKWGFSPAIGRKNHLGKRIKFEDLPERCRELVVNDYKDYWELG